MSDDFVSSLWGIPLLSFVTAGAGAYFGSYLKKKGENLATHEDLQKLVDQMKATTQATKEIETRLTDQAWDRQRQWELKRDIICQVAKQAFEAKWAGIKLKKYYRPQYTEEAEAAGFPPGPESQKKLHDTWRDAKETLYGSIVLVNLTCGKELAEDVFSLYREINDSGCGVLNEGEDVREAYVAAAREFDRVIDLLRKELEAGCVTTPQSTESSEAPSPDSSTPAAK